MNNSFTTNGWGIFNNDNFSGMIGSLFLNIIQWLCAIVYFFESIFWALVRGVPVKVDEATGQTQYKNLLDAIIFDGDQVFDFKNNSITAMLVLFIVIGFVLIILMSIIAIFKSHLSTKEEDKNPKNVILGGVKAVLLMIIFPVIIYCLLKVTNALVDSVCVYNNFDSNIKNSLANKIFFMFANGNAGTKNSIWYNNGTPNFTFLLSESWLGNQEGANVWEKLHSIDFIGGNQETDLGNYDYLLAILVLCVLVIGLFKSIMLLGKRIFDIIVLYLVAPFPIACVPNDDGKRFEAWKDQIVAKILSAFGLALSFAIYLVIVEELDKTFGNIASAPGNGWEYKTLSLTVDVNGVFNPGMVLTIVYIIILISGGLAIPQINTMLASLVSQSAGQVAGQDMSNLNADMAFMQRGAHAIGAGALFLADKTGALGMAKTALTGKTKNNGAGTGANPLAMTQNALNGQSGASGNATQATQQIPGKKAISTIGKTTGLNKGLLGAGGTVLKGALALGPGILAGGAFGIAAAAGVGVAGKAAVMGVKGINKKRTENIALRKEQQRQNEITNKVNDALKNYNDKTKLAEINKDIKKLGGREVNDQFVMEQLQAKENAKIANAKASSLSVDKPFPGVLTKDEEKAYKEYQKNTKPDSLDGFNINDPVEKSVKQENVDILKKPKNMTKEEKHNEHQKNTNPDSLDGFNISVKQENVDILKKPKNMTKEQKQAYKQEKRNEHLDQKLRDAQWKHQAEQAKLAEKQAKKEAKAKAKDKDVKE